MTPTAHPELFNSPLETGVRSVVLLNTAYPRAFDLKELTWLDHLVVHTSDISGPESLHPNVPHRDGELLVRRSLVEQGLLLMRSLHMIEVRYGTSGIVYTALDQAAPFVKLIRTEYGRALKERAAWLIDYLSEYGEEHLHEVITQKIGRWAVEFQSDLKPGGSA
ncbi:ABC-three component system middle component 2 [Pelagibacterium montanilacus]|uniref:ABC-three component system middle component 2 n=1 Tax=Pelagibacterium montanilacus TaxID=2185280 RepID=UPI000F8EE507|nr:ABC-three component system middle component 2 [Pelagibacterium montanilacus]